MQAGKKATTRPRHWRLANETEPREPSQLPFTTGPGRERALALLREALGADDMPSNTATESFAYFVEGLETMRINRDPVRLARMAASRNLHTQLAAAFDVLSEQLPRFLPEYEARARHIQWMNLPAGTSLIEQERLKHEALKMLVTGLDAAKSSGLMPLARFDEVPARWHDYAPRVAKIFREYLPSASKAAEYRFVAAIIPDLSGETPTFGAVEKHLKERRYVNRDKSKRTLS